MAIEAKSARGLSDVRIRDIPRNIAHHADRPPRTALLRAGFLRLPELAFECGEIFRDGTARRTFHRSIPVDQRRSERGERGRAAATAAEHRADDGLLELRV